MTERDKAARKIIAAKKSNTVTDTQLEDLKLLEKRVKGQIKYDLKQYGTEVLNNKDHHCIWKFIKNVTFTTNGGSTTTMDPIILNDYFSSVVRDPQEKECFIPLQADIEDAFQIQVPTVNEIKRLLKSTNAKASAGHDGLPGHLINNYAESLGHSISKLFNASINQATFPTEWK